MDIPFVKMHGLQNDFVVLDCRAVEALSLDPETIQMICHRRRGIGCDQLITLNRPNDSNASVHMGIYNQDGTSAKACGNATRCVGYLLTLEDGRGHHMIQTDAHRLETTATPDQPMVAVNFGVPTLDADRIPLSAKVDTLHLPITYHGLSDPVGVGVGNPHMVFFVYDAEDLDLQTAGAELTHHPLYPDGANVEVVSLMAPQTLRMRVYERGTGITPSCGTGAMASVVAAYHRGLVTSDPVTVVLDGGTLTVAYGGGDVRMWGDVHLTCRGHIALNPTGVLRPS